MFKILKNKIKQIDQFGHNISLNFEKKDYFVTFWGGILTIAMYALFILFFAINIKKFGTH